MIGPSERRVNDRRHQNTRCEKRQSLGVLDVNLTPCSLHVHLVPYMFTLFPSRLAVLSPLHMQLITFPVCMHSLPEHEYPVDRYKAECDHHASSQLVNVHFELSFRTGGPLTEVCPLANRYLTDWAE